MTNLNTPSETQAYEVANFENQDFSKEQIIEQITSGSLTIDSLVRPQGTEAWNSVKDLFPMIAQQESTTSEGSPTQMSAPIFFRFIAGLIDYLIFVIPTNIVGILMFSGTFLCGVNIFSPESSNPSETQIVVALLIVVISGLVMCLFLLLYYMYLIFLPTTSWRGTLGMYLMGLVMINEDGQTISFSMSILRIFVAQGTCFLFGLPYLWVFFDKQRRTLQDVVTHSLVVKKH